MHTSRTLTRFAIVFALVLSAVPLWAAGSADSEVVNINTADVSQLTQLPRIGPSLAQRIVEFRKENGEMKNTHDLILVRGIGERTFRLIEPFLVVQGKTTLTRKLRTADAEQALADRESAKGAKDPKKPAASADPSQRDGGV
ncbi:MAG: helix-hairpin-helix domain-containing protein [Acidobacteriota bacterium]